MFSVVFHILQSTCFNHYAVSALGLLAQHQSGSGLAPEESQLLVWLHVFLTVLGYAAFVLAFGVSICLLWQELALRRRAIGSLGRRMPSLLALDRLNTRCLCFGFCSSSLGLIIGLYFAFQQDLPWIFSDSRVSWSALTISVYAVLLGLIAFRGLRGRRAAWLSILGFSTVMTSILFAVFFGTGFHVY